MWHRIDGIVTVCARCVVGINFRSSSRIITLTLTQQGIFLAANTDYSSIDMLWQTQPVTRNDTTCQPPQYHLNECATRVRVCLGAGAGWCKKEKKSKMLLIVCTGVAAPALHHIDSPVYLLLLSPLVRAQFLSACLKPILASLLPSPIATNRCRLQTTSSVCQLLTLSSQHHKSECRIGSKQTKTYKIT